MAIFWSKLNSESRNHSSNIRLFFSGVEFKSGVFNGGNAVTNEKSKKRRNHKEYINRDK